MFISARKHFIAIILILFIFSGAGLNLYGQNLNLKNSAGKTPDENRFTKVTLSNDLNEPMELAVAPDGDVFFIERAGNFYRYDPVIRKTTLLYKFPVTALPALNGLLGLTIDPDYSHNRFVYLYHTVLENNQLMQYLSRYTLSPKKKLDITTEKIILKVPVDQSGRTHTGGSLAWDSNKNLYISTGDNTAPSESNGYAPIDERPGRKGFDAQRSAGNTNDLRGKILRIHPEENGSYTIPAGNLFAPGTEKTRPEIYIMGCRNPFRIWVDTATNILYWGEVGPDAFFSGKRGSHGFDEFNEAKKAGNYGWPYFVGDNQPYARYNFATKAIGAFFDPEKPVNNSVNNTGLVNLPPAQKAMIWYPYGNSELFPLMGSGGRAAMCGPVYHYDAALQSSIKFPAYYDKALFVSEWMRKMVLAVRFDENNNYKSMERFLPATGNFIRAIDMQFGNDGALYILEYGEGYSMDNPDARLVKIEYNPGNRAPVSLATATNAIGHIPLKVMFNGTKSTDPDAGDKITFKWYFGDGNSTSSEISPVHVYKRNGIYKAVLQVTDQHGKTGNDTVTVKVGNTPPKVAIHVSGNNTFFFPGINRLNYHVSITDKEDRIINKKHVKITLNYLPDATMNAPVTTSLDPEVFGEGKALIASNDCKACHQEYRKVIGPAFIDVSNRYKNDKKAVSSLSNKIITGGSGSWGNDAMSAHPQLKKEDAEKIVTYILSLSRQQKPLPNLPQKGILTLNKHLSTPSTGRYILTASYTDNGGLLMPFTDTKKLILRPALIHAGDEDSISRMQKYWGSWVNIYDRSFFVLKNIDVTGIKNLAYNYSAENGDATINVRLDSVKGPLLSTAKLKSAGAKFQQITASIVPTNSRHDLYFIFEGNQLPKKSICTLKWLQFKRSAK